MGYPTLRRLDGKLSPRLTGLSYLADRATRLSGLLHLSCKRDQDKMRDYMERQVTPPRQVISPTWGPPPPCKQARRNIVNNFGNPQSLVAQLMVIYRVCLEVPCRTCRTLYLSKCWPIWHRKAR